MPSDDLTKFYSRTRSCTVFDFYISKDKQLIGEVTCEGKIEQLSIGIPHTFQVDLDEKKIRKLIIMFEKSYFSVQCGKIMVNSRGLGGWGEDVHRNATATWLKEMISAYYHRLPGKVEARLLGSVAEACNAVDYLLEWTGPFPRPFGDLSLHFNYSDEQNGSAYDTRIVYAAEKLKEAIDSGLVHAAKPFGQGLHALQDVFAHTKHFSMYFGCSPFAYFFKFHSPSAKADDPKYIGDEEDSPVSRKRQHADDGFSQRYTDTELATKFYALTYVYNVFFTKIDHQQFRSYDSSYIRKYLSDIQCYSGKTDYFRGLLEALEKINVECPISVADIYTQFSGAESDYDEGSLDSSGSSNSCLLL